MWCPKYRRRENLFVSVMTVSRYRIYLQLWAGDWVPGGKYGSPWVFLFFFFPLELSSLQGQVEGSLKRVTELSSYLLKLGQMSSVTCLQTLWSGVEGQVANCCLLICAELKLLSEYPCTEARDILKNYCQFLCRHPHYYKGWGKCLWNPPGVAVMF